MTSPIPHGGRLAEARRAHPSAPTPWLDLSTGVNPEGWRQGRAPTAALSRLPDPADLEALEAAAAGFFGCDPARVVAVPGAEAGLRLLPSVLDAARVAIASPTYGSHADAWRLAGAQVTEVERAALFRQPTDAFVVVNPNNPDGTLTPGAELVAGAAGRWLVIDESFIEVAPEFSAVSAMTDRTVVLRSFGKFHGLPGVRLGFVVASPERAARLRLRIGDWPVGADAISLGVAAYGDAGWAERTRRRLERDAVRLDRLLVEAGFEIVGGTSLFRLTRAGDAKRRAEALAEQGVLVRTFAHDPMLIRFGLPGRKEWPRLQAALESLR